MRYTPDHITHLEDDEVFVFGSNLAGRHGMGAALTAKEIFGAEYGVGEGPTGQCYALPTKGRSLRVLTISQIAYAVEDFLEYASNHPDKTFLVTKIGCGLAGYKPDMVGRLFFAYGPLPTNVVLPREFHPE